MADDTFPLDALIYIVIFIAFIAVLPLLIQRYRRRRYAPFRREHSSPKGAPQSPATFKVRSVKNIRVPFKMPRFPAVQNKLKILAGIVTFIVVIVVLSESVVIVEAGHR